jgi:hypothetical protein
MSEANKVFMDPVRVRLSRKRGAKLPPNTVAVARGPGRRWGNPFVVGKPAPADFHGLAHASMDLHPLSQEEAVALFRRWLGETEQGRALAQEARTELRGKNLACWCRPDQACHADIWLEVANKASSGMFRCFFIGPDRGPSHPSGKRCRF